MSKKIALLLATLATVLGVAAPAHADTTTTTTVTATTCTRNILEECVHWP